MRRDNVRYWSWLGVALLLVLVLISGCTRSKSSGPPEPTATEAGAPSVTQPPVVGASPTPGLSGDASLAATTTAWAVETATAGAASAEGTQVGPTDTSEPEETEATATPTSELVLEATKTPQPTESPTAGEGTHTVQAGENLFRIALEYGLGYQALAAYNGIANPHIIFVGQVLKIPGAGEPVVTPSPGVGYHVVQAGENLYRVALKYNMLYTRLAAANNLSYPYTIYVGQRLNIP
jgi:LysM repeat protein